MKKYFFLFVALIIILLAGCSSKYKESDFIGKTSAEIENEFGKFDCCGMPMEDDGLYKNTACGYTLKEPRKGFLGTSDEWLMFICFDENGVAHECYEGYRPGG